MACVVDANEAVLLAFS